jgi:hypothetical protein
MLTKTKIVLAAALIATTASAALASNENDDKGGFVVPGSMDGVNPAYHPTRFPGYAAPQAGGQAYGFYAPVQKPAHRPTHVRTQDQ